MFNGHKFVTMMSARYPDFSLKYQEYFDIADEKKTPIGEYFYKMGIYDPALLKISIASAYGVKVLREEPEHCSELTSQYIPLPLAKNYKIAVFEDSGEKLKIVTADPHKDDMFRMIRKKINLPLDIYYAFGEEIDKALENETAKVDFKKNFEHLKDGALRDLSSIESLKDSSKLLDVIMMSALRHKSSDIHIEPQEGRLLIRFRVDGILKDIIDFPLELADIVVTRIKVLANLRTDEHFKPQDGRFKITLEDGAEITTRISILPVNNGEKVVMRILTARTKFTDLISMGYTEENQRMVYDNLDKAHGMLLVTGPTGSGKTTTLYNLLKRLNKPELNIMTIEDPIEYQLDRINQIQVNNASGLSFAQGLRSILRQDPDIIMVGEIRDEETASIAVNSALTGHLVLATLHTNSSIDSLPRLLEMNVEPYLVASTVNVVIAQRLIRSLCSYCKEEFVFTREIMNSMIKEESKSFCEALERLIPIGTVIYRPRGCTNCKLAGYSGRYAISEVLNVTDDIKESIYNRNSPLEIEKKARKKGFTSLMEDGLLKVTLGVSSLEEILRVSKE